MPKYYAFLVKKDVRKLYFERETELYILLRKLYKSNNGNAVLRISLFNQIFDIINVNILKEYLDKKINVKNKKNKYLFFLEESIEKTLIEINYSCIIIVTNFYSPSFFKPLKYIYNGVFICDFDNNNYFFLHKH